MNAIVFTALWGVIMMIAGAFVRSTTAPRYMGMLGIILVFVVNAMELTSGFSLFTLPTMDMVRSSTFNLTFLAVVFGITFLIFLLNGRDIEKIGKHKFEYFAILFFILCGVSLVSTFNNLLLLFLGIEIMTIPLYILTGSDKRNLVANEAALKYFLLGSFSTGLMLMGIAFLYGSNPVASFYINNMQFGVGALPVLTVIGMLLLLSSMSFKVSVAPFHFWTPDVYDGAPTVVTSFMSSVIKIAGFFAFLRLFENAFGVMHAQWQMLIALLIVATLLVGNITAIFQQSVKRMMAYSSIAQAGFMLFALFAMNDMAREGLVLYSAAYSLASIGVFGVLARMDDITYGGFNGMGKTHPLLALGTTVCLLSLTGIPLTAGFLAKFYMLASAVQTGVYFWLVVVAVLFAAVSAYYYFRVIRAIYFKSPEGNNEGIKVSRSFEWILLLIACLIIALGINPEWLLGWMFI
ncbi:MAG: NADH-quinone oxidoreductase subunit N [Ferruginibacter sp.]|nr:NADH-quinone oxidoreductase subunit N [Ferruginibacter sp.]